MTHHQGFPSEHHHHSSQPERYTVGSRVRLNSGYQVGRSGVIIQIVEKQGRKQYTVEFGDGERAYCDERELM